MPRVQAVSYGGEAQQELALRAVAIVTFVSMRGVIGRQRDHVLALAGLQLYL